MFDMIGTPCATPGCGHISLRHQGSGVLGVAVKGPCMTLGCDCMAFTEPNAPEKAAPLPDEDDDGSDVDQPGSLYDRFFPQRPEGQSSVPLDI